MLAAILAVFVRDRAEEDWFVISFFSVLEPYDLCGHCVSALWVRK